MKFTISKDRKTLTIEADPATIKNHLNELAELGRNIQSDEELHSCFESMLSNSELQWVTGQTSGDLTDAPMLGILGYEVPDTANIFDEIKSNSFGMVQCGQNGLRKYFQPILERWAYMNYAVRSPLEDLRDTGKAIFTS